MYRAQTLTPHRGYNAHLLTQQKIGSCLCSSLPAQLAQKLGLTAVGLVSKIRSWMVLGRGGSPPSDGHGSEMRPLFSVSPQSKLVKYFSRQLSCKKKVALQERNAELDGFPQLRHWFRIVDVRKEVLEVTRGDPCSLPPAPSWPEAALWQWGFGCVWHRGGL